MKSMIRNVDDHGVCYQALLFVCPACGHDLHMLPVNTTEHSPSWEWDGNLEAPTLSPSILTKWGNENPKDGKNDKDDQRPYYVCHSFLKAGVFEYLSDCTHEFANQKLDLPDLPEWIINEE